MQQAAVRKVVPMAEHPAAVQRVTKASGAVDSRWAEIAQQINEISRRTQEAQRYWNLDEAQAEACQAILKNCIRMRRLQEVQRKGYSHDADEGLAKIAGVFVPAAARCVTWPRIAQYQIDLAVVAAAHIARLANQRLADNQD